MAQEDEIVCWKEYNEKIIIERNTLLIENEKLQSELTKIKNDIRFKKQRKS